MAGGPVFYKESRRIFPKLWQRHLFVGTTLFIVCHIGWKYHILGIERYDTFKGRTALYGPESIEESKSEYRYRMVIAERNNNNNESISSSISGTNSTANRRTRTLNQANVSNTMSSSGGGTSCSSDINSDSDSEQSVRVGNEYQAEISDSCQSKPASRDYVEKAVLVWTPYHELDEDDLSDYVKLANEKYKYNQEQALGILFWHDFDMQCALADLPNYAPYPDEWTMEDRALFDQAYQFHNKSFHKINQLLPDKKLSSIIKHYYTTKKNKNRNGSYVDKQVRKNNSQSKDESPDDNGSSSMMMDYANDEQQSTSNHHQQHHMMMIASTSKEQQHQHQLQNQQQNQQQQQQQQFNHRKECCQCMNKNAQQYYNTKYGILCKICYAKRKSNHHSKSCNDPTTMGDEISKFGKLFNSMNMDEMMLKEIVKERVTESSAKVLESYDKEIDDLMGKICHLKQENQAKKSSLGELPDLSLLNNNNNRIMSRWTNDEILLMTQAIRDYGKDFKVIADIIGTKSEVQIKNYFLQNQDKMKFDTLIAELNEENDMDDMNLYIIDDNNPMNGENSKKLSK
ncbi:rest corepressor 2-like protein [Dermatophagoides farinae]|uniref:Rest corepressor 2-like protein n=1 Tax=Dermatophagoides farinae TaxID=6954 RepID=A0A9D4P7S3_DERFA|nr:rest corepressor 2-like protein [Dermatophagoides farinae]